MGEKENNCAGAVPLPTPGVADADGKPFAYWPSQLSEYGNDREAAGRAGAVPEADPRLIDIWRALDSTLGDTDPYLADDMTDEDIREDSPVWWATRELRAMIDAARIPQQPAAEGDDIAVDRFAEAMKAKMAAARAKGRGGWEGPTCNADILSRMLRDHVEKGDPRDVANFCMMLWNRGEAIQAAEGAGREAVASIKEVTGDGGGKVLDWPKGMVRFLREHPVGTKLYTHPAPAADAGGVKVTEEMVERVWMAATGRTRLGKGWENDAKFMTAEERADTRAALAPEVRHGE